MRNHATADKYFYLYKELAMIWLVPFLCGERSTMDIFQVEENQYKLIKSYRKGWKQNAFRKRYVDLLEKYDYIVGDWGYGQLRLKGFYDDTHELAERETKYSFLEEYLSEYCNFGCAYFILKKLS
jgi:uncharacterized protein YutD